MLMAIWMMESFVLNFAAVLLLILGPCGEIIAILHVFNVIIVMMIS